MVGQLVSGRWQSLCMGTMLLNAGVAAVLASFFSNYDAAGPSKTVDPLITNPFYSRAFLQLGLLTLAIALALLIAIPLIQRLIKGKDSSSHLASFS